MKQLSDAFKNSLIIDIDAVDDIDNYDIYVIDLNNATKEISQKLVSIFKKKEKSLIYFIIPKDYTLLLFQLTFLLDTKAIITHNQDIDTIISNIKIENEVFIQTTFESWLGNIQIKTQNFIVYKYDELVFVSKPLLALFGCNDTNLFEKNTLSKVNIKNLLTNDISLSTDIVNNQNVNKTYIFKSLSISDSDKIIYVEQDIYKETKLDFMSSRVTFIELLKENILQRNMSYKELSLLTISISNIKQILAQYNIVETEDILFDMLTFMESILDTKLIFAQFENNFYVVLFEDIPCSKSSS